MKIFFYMRRNPITVSGISSKIWKIERRGRIVSTWWGHADFERKKRKPIKVHDKLQSKEWKFRTEAEAKSFEETRIKRKLSKGYERSPRRKSQINRWDI